MGKRASTELKEVHWKALNLIEEGELSYKEIAEQCGWSPQYLYDLVGGDEKTCGYIGALFSAEVRKINAKLESKINGLLKTNKSLALQLINQVLHSFKKIKNLDLDEVKVLTRLNDTLAKATPSVKIGSLSYSYTKGLSAEELLYEFNRLQSIANGASNREAVRESFQRRQGSIHRVTESGSTDAEQSEDFDVSADGEAG